MSLGRNIHIKSVATMPVDVKIGIKDADQNVNYWFAGCVKRSLSQPIIPREYSVAVDAAQFIEEVRNENKPISNTSFAFLKDLERVRCAGGKHSIPIARVNAIAILKPFTTESADSYANMEWLDATNVAKHLTVDLEAIESFARINARMHLEKVTKIELDESENGKPNTRMIHFQNMKFMKEITIFA